MNFLNAFASNKNRTTLTSPPIWLMRQAGRYLPEYREIRANVPDFLTMCFTPELATEVTLQPIRRFGFDAAILFSDILVIPHALGQEVRFVPGTGPVLSPLQNLHSLKWEAERLSTVYTTVAEVRKQLPSETALIGFAGAPWTVISYMLEGGSPAPFSNCLNWCYQRPMEMEALLELVTVATIDHLMSQAKAGANALQVFDSWAGAVPAPLFDQLVVQPTRKIVATIKEEFPEIPIIGFPRGAGVQLVDYARLTGVDGIGLDQFTPARWAAQQLCPYVTVQGNLDPQLLLHGGPALIRQAKMLVETFQGKPFIFNLGHGVIKETPPEHVAQLVQTVRGNPG